MIHDKIYDEMGLHKIAWTQVYKCVCWCNCVNVYVRVCLHIYWNCVHVYKYKCTCICAYSMYLCVPAFVSVFVCATHTQVHTHYHLFDTANISLTSFLRDGHRRLRSLCGWDRSHKEKCMWTGQAGQWVMVSYGTLRRPRPSADLFSLKLIQGREVVNEGR